MNGESEMQKCIKCGKHLTNEMACQVFVVEDGNFRRVNGLLCVTHGSNGANSLSVSDYRRMTESV